MNAHKILRSTGISILLLTAPAATATAATFLVAAADVGGLKAALALANANDQPDTIHLAAGSVYLLTTVDNTENGGGTALPIVTGDTHTLLLDGHGATLRRDASAAPFRMLSTGADADVAIVDLRFEGGSSTTGGAILSRGRMSIRDSTFAGNRAANGVTGAGGAIVSLGLLEIDACAFEGNQTDADGGAIFVGGYASVHGSDFAANTAIGAGGALGVSGELVVSDCTFDGNESGSVGGAVATATGRATIRDSRFDANLSQASGGAIISSGDLSVENSHFWQNRAVTGYGGAIVVAGVASDITGSTLSANRSDAGGGVAILGSTILTIDQSTLTLNDAATAGSGLYQGSGSALVRNTIVAGNVGSDVDGPLAAGSAHNFIGGSVRLGPLQGNGGRFPTHALLPDSPAIDAGDDTIVTSATDLRGFSRISGSGVDIGAVEFQQPALLVATSGSGQGTVVGTLFPASLEVGAYEVNGVPIRNFPVTFSAPSGGAGASFPAGDFATTDSTGRARVAVLANTVAGSYGAVARLAGLGTGASFSLTNVAGDAEVLTVWTGSPQSAALGSVFAQRLRARATDAYGNPVIGFGVAFTVPPSGPSGSFVSAMTSEVVPTDSGGIAAAPVLTANDVAGGWSLLAQGDGIPSLFTAFSLTNVNLDPDAPTVTRVDGAAATPDGQLSECETVHGAAMSRLAVRFSEAMEDPAGDTEAGDVTHPASWLLVEAGPDAVFDTAGCSGPGGDDVAAAIDSITYDGGSFTATLLFADGELAGHYRLFACASGGSPLRDLAGNPLDGDGDGAAGDDFVRSFRADPTNLLANGHFDCDLGDWARVSTNPLEIVSSPDDADGSADSGSAAVENLTASTDFALGQCVAATGLSAFDLGARVRLSAATSVAVEESCTFFAGSLCGGSALATALDSSLLLDTAGAWVELGTTFFAPAGSASMLCSVGFFAAGGTDFEAGVDQVHLASGGAVFADGFESGELSAWSSALP